MQIFVNGLLQGVLIGAVGVAFALVYRTTKVFYVALGGSVASAPYLASAALGTGLHGWLSAMVAVVLVAAIGILVEEAIHWPLARKRAPPEVHLIASLGAYLVLVQCIAIVWGNETRVFKSGADATLSFGGITLAQAQLVGPTLALVATVGLFGWLNGANRGTELRALADNPVLVALLGRNVRVLRRWAFGLSGALAATVALAQAWDVGYDPHTGLNVVLLGMAAMIIGGTGSTVGPLIGGILLGVLRAEVVWLGSARWQEAATFAVLALFLFFRPQGLFARPTRIEDVA